MTQNTIWINLIVAIFFLAIPTFAQESVNYTKIVVSGKGETQAEAIQDAWRQAMADHVEANIDEKFWRNRRDQIERFIAANATKYQGPVQIVLPFAQGEIQVVVALAGADLLRDLHKAYRLRPLVTNPAIVVAMLLAILAVIFATSSSERPFWQKFYTFVPSLLLCYFLPSLLGTFDIVTVAGKHSNLYYVVTRFLLPASLVFLTLSIDLKGIMKLGPKALIMFFTATVSIVLGGPIALWIVAKISPDTVVGEGSLAVWRGMSTLAGSWIGGGANQAAMKEIFEVDNGLFSSMVAVDVLVANVWMAFLLYGASRHKAIDARIKADNSAIEELKERVIEFQKQHSRVPATKDLMVLLAIGLGITGCAHAIADWLVPLIETHAPQLSRFSLTSKFFWIIVLVTTGGLVMSFTKMRNLEGVGASRLGSVFIYILVATMGVRMDILAITEKPGLFAIGFIWIFFHIVVLLTVARLIRAPFFFVAVGSQANIGGAASAPVVASAVHPALAPVGVLLAVLGYALGTYGAWLCAQMMRVASGGS